MKLRNLSDEALGEIATLLKALADKTRLKIMKSLQEGEKNVTEIIEATGGLQANISKHIQILSRAHLVVSRREGTSIYYRVSDPSIHQVCQSVCDGYGRILEKKLASIKKLNN